MSPPFFDEEQRPLTYTPDALVDPYGDFVYVDEDDPDEAISDEERQGVGVGAPISQAIVAGGLYNGDFLLPPADPADPISDTNPLPYWRLHTEAGVTVHHVVDPDAVGGVALRWSVPASGLGDRILPSYIEQIIPVSGTEQVRAPTIVVEPLQG